MGDIFLGYDNVYEAQMSTNDTTTLAEFDVTRNLDIWTAIKKSDRTVVTMTCVNNVLTLTQAGLTNENIIIFAAGIKAS